MNMLPEKEYRVDRFCDLCGKIIRGRSDKRFCDDYCRNTHNNRLKGVVNNRVRNINHALNKNRRILENLLQESNSAPRTNRERLEQMGFQFKYLTHVQVLRGKTYHYCYDHGYARLDNDWYQIVKRTEE
jgi:hypothetical protein